PFQPFPLRLGQPDIPYAQILRGNMNGVKRRKRDASRALQDKRPGRKLKPDRLLTENIIAQFGAVSKYIHIFFIFNIR
ncbi:hypothetical protein SMA90_32800, partial [Escherichia coli]